MNQFAVQIPTLSDVGATIRGYQSLPPKKREAMMSALRSLESWSGRRLKDIPANVPELGAVFEVIQPAALNIAPKTLANVKSLCLKALATSELAPGFVHKVSSRRPKDPAWAAIYNALTTFAQRNGLSRLINWCNRNGEPPEAVGDAIIERVMAEMAASSLRPNQYQVRRTMTRYWNEVVDIFPDLSLQKVTVPPSRLRRTRVPLTALPQSFLDDWNSYAKWAHGEDVFADDARPVALKQSSLDVMLRRIHLAANALVEAGTDRNSICKLSDLVSVDAFRSILRHRYEVTGGKSSYDNLGMAMNLLQIANEWVKVDPETLAELKRLKDKVPKVQFQMSRKNKLLITQFDQSTLKERLLSAPDRIWTDVQASTKKRRLRLAEAQAALAINILMYLPVRLGNLCALAFDEHLIVRESGTSTLTLSAEETKTGAGVDYEIPRMLAARLIEFREVIAHSVMGVRPKYLFCNVDGSLKDLATTRFLIQRYVKQYVGIHMNPHVFRHLAAKFILDNNPGAHVVVQHLLGHKSLATTATFYAGVDTVRAGRHHQALLEQAIASRKFSTGPARLDAQRREGGNHD
ncbi:site-specific integrase [Mesorhizobium sp. Root552]|uniref:site-specific integrase n=1 Tax=Mesorhizobium sp. Root552 TaxID=1736555 RepID=UPI000A989776|nr:site-specific integrase [Mesorhizobium sp. Root552]